MRHELEVDTDLQRLFLDPDGPAVVAIGGGHGQATALEAVQTYARRISALVSVADDGGSSGRLTALGMPPPGDVRRCLLALTAQPSLASELFAHRFEAGDVADHSLGNLILAGLTDLFGGFTAAVESAQQMLQTLGDVIPVADNPVRLSAVVDGKAVEGQVSVATAMGHISDLSIDPPGTIATRKALGAVATADQIVLGPGSLYTSVISALMVQMLAPAVATSSATKVLVLNLMTQQGETSGLNGAAHIAELEKFTGIRGPGYVVSNTGAFDVPTGLSPVELDAKGAEALGWEVVHADVVDDSDDWPSHDPIKLGEVLEKLIDT